MTDVEAKRIGDPRYTFNLLNYKAEFQTEDDALEHYNYMGYKNGIQFKKYEVLHDINPVT